ncbi:MAG: tRNA (guanosine(37)-N1)-methyltransferase TrmD [Clostridia bacterium]|nr:tRNA (guanosine(37)-N1)-methyltransferase TrmD [Clostridia bacterium]
MRIDIMTIFTNMCESVLRESIVGRAIKEKLVKIKCHDIRDFAYDKHKRVDDSTYGPGMGMLMKAEPIYLCFEDICKQIKKEESFENQHPQKVIYMSPQGATLTQQKAKMLAEEDNLIILCGHYEGVDERVLEEIVEEEISIGDYVLTGGELPALVLVDAIVRMIPGVLSSDECYKDESHYSGLLEYPQYTKPSLWHNKKVPDVLLSGNHEKIKTWKKEQSMLRTLRKRPDIFKDYNFSAEEKEFINGQKK